MKKVFVTFLAVASVIACTKSNVEFEETTEIGLKPVAHNVTKSMMTGTAFKTSESFNVWAFYKQLPAGKTIAEWQAATDVEQTTYIDEKTFVYNNATTDATTNAPTWKGATSYYWPKVGSLLFTAYYPTTVADKVTYEFSDAVVAEDKETVPAKNQMVITDYQQSRVASTGYSEDLMYANMTPSSYSANNVALTFKHALSWISVVLVKSSATPDDATITVSKVEFTGVKPQGDAVVNGASEIAWSSKGTAANVNVVESTQTLTKDNTAQLAYEPLFIPQAMNDMVVTYNIKSGDGSNFTEVKTITLNTLESTDKTTYSKWEPGKHYTYTISIGTSEILIAPTVTDWENVNYAITPGVEAQL